MTPPDRQPSDQRSHWDRVLAEREDRYGDASSFARSALDSFRAEGTQQLLELGAGQGRDTFLFAGDGIDVTALDFAESAINTIRTRAKTKPTPGTVHAAVHDARDPLPFSDESFDACFSHMLFNMALSERELGALNAEIRRVLKPGGLNVFSTRSTEDPDFGHGIHHGENRYELDGFEVHFLDQATVSRLATGYEIVSIEQFEEGDLPRRLLSVTLRNPAYRF